jgi:transcriptional regulator with XRE-family HTH domain
MTVATERRTRPARAVTRAQHVAFSHWAFIDAMRDAEMEPDELAEEMGASIEAIARWMAGIATPRPLYAQSAARILGVNIDDFYEMQ